MDIEEKREVWVQDLTDRNLFYNRILNLKLPEAALEGRPNPVIKITYDREADPALPFGYSWSNGKSVIVPAHADVVRLVFELNAHGLSAEKIAKKFDSTATLDGEVIWHPSIIRKILKDEQAYREGILSNDSSIKLPPILK